MFLTKEAVRLGLPGYADAIESAGTEEGRPARRGRDRPTGEMSVARTSGTPLTTPRLKGLNFGRGRVQRTLRWR
jgi:hypothetical protein